MADKKVVLKIISPGQTIDERVPKEANMVILRCVSGDLGILPGRMPCSMSLGTGLLRVINDGDEKRLNISGGIASVSHDVVTVLTESVECVD